MTNMNHRLTETLCNASNVEYNMQGLSEVHTEAQERQLLILHLRNQAHTKPGEYNVKRMLLARRM